MLEKDVSAMSGEDSKPQLPPGKKLKGRKQNHCMAKSKATVDTEKSESSDDERPPKSHSGQGVQSSRKLGDLSDSSTDQDTKTIVKDRSLLIKECVRDAQTEYDERHQAKVAGARDILQSDVMSDPKATTKFGKEQVETHLSLHKKDATIAKTIGEAKKDATHIEG